MVKRLKRIVNSTSRHAGIQEVDVNLGDVVEIDTGTKTHELSGYPQAFTLSFRDGTKSVFAGRIVEVVTEIKDITLE